MFSSQEMQLFSDLWKSVGMEITIFAVTLTCALCLRWLSPAPQGKKIAFSKKAPPGPPERRQHRNEMRRTPSDIFEDAMEGLLDWQSASGVPSTRILSLYSELRQTLRATGQTLSEVASTKQRANDFYSSLVQLVIRTGKSNMLTLIMDDMADQGVSRTIQFYESVMKQLAVQKQFRAALGVYDKLVTDGLETSTVTYSCLVRFATEVGDLSRAKIFFEKLASLTTPSIRAYMTILSVHSKRQDWHSAVDVIHDMVDRGVPVDSLALNMALSTGVAADKVSEIQDLLAEAESMTPFVPDVVSYNTVIKAAAQRADYTDSLKLMQRMLRHNVQPNIITYNTVMDAAVRAGKPAEAWKKFEEMRKLRFHTDKFTCSILVKASARLICHEKEEAVDRILKLLDDFDHCLSFALKTNLYSNVAEAVAKADLQKEMLKVVAQMRSKGVNTAPVLQKSMVSALLRHSEQEYK